MKKERKKKRTGLKVAIVIEVLIVLAVAGNLIILGYDQADTSQIQADIIETKKLDLKSISVSDIKNTKELWLVNASNPIKNRVTESTMTAAYQKIALSRSDIKLKSSALQNIIKIFDEAEKNNITDLVVTSGYRTYQKQSLLYEQAEDKSLVQKAGCSEHETGLAVDIQLEKGGMDNLGDTTQGKWLQKNAWKYGFILRYPKEKSDITGISYESWHFRYVGLPHAAFIQMKDLCLEEYIDYLKNNKQYAIKIGDTSYQVYRQVAKNGKIEVPKDLDYTVSDDNCGGYIVTVILK